MRWATGQPGAPDAASGAGDADLGVSVEPGTGRLRDGALLETHDRAAALERLGYPATPYDPGTAFVQRDREGRRLILALAVAAGAAALSLGARRCGEEATADRLDEVELLGAAEGGDLDRAGHGFSSCLP